MLQILGLFVSGLDIEQYDFKPSLKDNIMSADLVIAHAGAGTCLEGKYSVKSVRSSRLRECMISDELKPVLWVFLCYNFISFQC